MTGLRVGISGWTYPPWRGVFYPEGLAQKRELEYASRQLNSIEINGSFYSLQRPESWRSWYEQTPDDFLFAVKGGRFITHMKKLKDVRPVVANFFAQGVLRLGEKLGPVLWQFPPQLAYSRERFEPFLEMLPRTHAAAGRLAEETTIPRPERIWTEPEHTGALRYAFEVRHPSFMVPEFVELLAAHRVALVLADTSGKWPYAEDMTGDLVYARLHGAEELYASGYTEEQLRWWATRLRRWREGGEPRDRTVVTRTRRRRPEGRDVYVYFDNDAKVHAPFDAQRLAELLTPGAARRSGSPARPARR
jgi:uncharacterized protein YecE (DUF72 family)